MAEQSRIVIPGVQRHAKPWTAPPVTSPLTADETRLVIEASEPIHLAEQPPVLSSDLNISVLGKTWEELRERPSQRPLLQDNPALVAEVEDLIRQKQAGADVRIVPVRRHPTTSSVCVALFRPGTSGADVLLHLRADNQLWGLPGGALEYGESVEHAVRREMEEETGLAGFEVRGIVSVHSDPATGALFTYPDGNTVHYVCVTVLAWMADWEASAAGLRASAESLALYWFPYEASHASLPEPFSPIHQRRLETAWECLTCPMTAPLLLLG